MTEQSILAAVSGIQANQTYLDSIGNNIANVNTVGFKAGQVQFQDLLSQQLGGGSAPTTGSAGVNPLAIGSGVRVASDQLNLSEGSLESTGINTDVAIQGSGYLLVQSGGQQYYTRDGALTPDANGNLATQSGGLVLGWAANSSGQVNNNAPLTAIKIPTGETIGASPTSELTLGGNLPAWNGSGTPPSPVTTLYNAYDALGNVVPVTLTFTPEATANGFSTNTANTWMLNATVTMPDGSTKNIIGTPGSTTGGTATAPTGDAVVFDPTTGQLQSVNGTAVTAGNPSNLSVALTGITASGTTAGYDFASGATWNLTFPATDTAGAVTQFAGSPSMQIQSGDGNTAGMLASYSIGNDGTITGTFSNGSTLALGQIALATFANPGGLSDQGGGLFSTSPNSGQALTGAPGSGGRGTLLGGELEQSNVDLGSELTNLITAQEAYAANTKVLTATNMSIQALEAVQ